jgi:Flagellar assembly protein FliH
MRWFEEDGMADAPRRVKFAQAGSGHVGPRHKYPSWLPASQKALQAPPPPRLETPSLRPPPLPSEFVDAVRQELGDMPQPERPSIRPPRAPTQPPPPAAAAEPSPVAAAPIHVPVPVVDPEICQAFEQAVELLALERQRVFEQTASQLAELAAVIARRVIAREISLAPELVLGLVREGLEALGKHDRVVIRLGGGFEEQRDLVEQRLVDRGSRAEVRVDPHLPEFACLVETELGRVDESVETRLATLLHALRPDSQPLG